MGRKKRRGNNEGTIVKRKDGRWAGVVTVGRDAEGRVVRRWFYGKTRDEVNKKLVEALGRRHQGTLTPASKLTFEAYAEQWLETQKGKSANTLRNYKDDLRKACVVLGKMKLQDVKPAHVKQLVQKLEGLSQRTKQKVLQRVRSVFEEAVRDELISRNPAAAVRLARVERQSVGITLEPEEVKKFMAAFEKHPMGLLFRLMLECGLRKGEALALKWQDLELGGRPVVRVRRSWSGSGRSGHLTEGKTVSARRDVPIPDGLAEALRVLRKATVDVFGENIGDMFLFGNAANGRPFEANAPNHALRRLCEREGLRKIRVHDLRHTFGSLQLAAGEKVEVVAQWMGHRSAVVTWDVYRHVLKGESEKLRSVVEIAEEMASGLLSELLSKEAMEEGAS